MGKELAFRASRRIKSFDLKKLRPRFNGPGTPPQEVIRGYVDAIAEVAATLEPGTEDITEREEKFEALIDRFEATEDPIRHGMATVMLSFLAGLFVGEEAYEAIRDNLESADSLPRPQPRRPELHRGHLRKPRK